MLAPCNLKAARLLLTGTSASPGHKTLSAAVCSVQMGKDTVPALPPGDSGTGKSLG